MTKKNPTVMITGGSSGIGQCIASVLAKDGYDVAVTYSSNDEGVEETREFVEKYGRRFFAIQADLDKKDTAEEAVSEAIRLLGKLDLLVCNAGASIDQNILTISGKESSPESCVKSASTMLVL